MQLRDKPHRRIDTVDEEPYIEADRIWRLERGIPHATEQPRTGKALKEAQMRQDIFLSATPTQLTTMANIEATWSMKHDILRHDDDKQRRNWALMWALSPEQRYIIIEKWKVAHEWKTGTTLSYLERMKKILPILAERIPELPRRPTVIDAQMLRDARDAHESRIPAPPIIMSPPETALALKKLRNRGTPEATQAAAMLETTYRTIGRQSDTNQVLRTSISRLPARCLSDGTTLQAAAAFQVHSGKTIVCTGTLARMVTGTGAAALLDIAQAQASASTHEDLTIMSGRAKAQLRSVMPQGKTQRAIRKGAAVAAACNGVADVDLQEQMGHATLKMTRMYLGQGLFSHSARVRAAQIEAAIDLDAYLHMPGKD